jgi:hypothetical protein
MVWPWLTRFNGKVVYYLTTVRRVRSTTSSPSRLPSTVDSGGVKLIVKTQNLTTLSLFTNSLLYTKPLRSLLSCTSAVSSSIIPIV